MIYGRPADRTPNRISPVGWIVVSVVAVGLAVAITAYVSKSHADAARAAGARNLQQWGIALNLWLIDNQNQLPSVGEVPITADQTSAWFNALPPYISQKPLAELPEGKHPRPGVPSLWIDPSTRPVKIWDRDTYYFNYAMNRYLQPKEGARSFRIYEISRPSNVVFLAEVSDYTPAATPADVVFRQGGSGPQSRSVVLFCDGHIQIVTRAKLVDDPAALRADSAENGLSWYKD